MKPAVGTLVVMEAADSAEFVGFRTPIPAIHHLARTVTALPLHLLMPLDQAFVKAKGRLGSGDLAAHDLRQHARGRRLTVAARRILPDGTEQAFILRSAFWRYFTILSIHAGLDPHLETASIQGDAPLTGWLTGPGRWWPGRWHFFVGCRRFDRLYSTVDDRRAVNEAQPSSKLATKPPRPGSADFWIGELFPNEAWRLLRPSRIHRAIEQEIEKRNAELVQKAKSRSEKATLLEHVSLTAVRQALKRRLER